jgi:uncharacterized protein YybS (DUF2232 family)
MFLTMRYGYTAGWLCVLIVSGFLQLLAGINGVIMYLMVFGLLSIMLGAMVKRGFSAARVVIAGGVLLWVLLLSWVLFERYAHNVDALGPVKKELNRLSSVEEIRGEYMKSYSCAPGGINKEIDGKLLGKAAMHGKNLRKGILAVIIITSLGAVGIVYLVAGRVFADFGMKLGKPAVFSAWRPREEFIWFLIAGCIAYAYGKYSGIKILDNTGYNLSVVAVFIYLINGVSLVSHFFKMFKVTVMMRFIGYFVLFTGFEVNGVSYSDFSIFSNYLFPIALGVSDVWIDYRKRIIAVKEKEI